MAARPAAVFLLALGTVGELSKDGAPDTVFQTREAESCWDAFLNKVDVFCLRPVSLTLPLANDGRDLVNQSSVTKWSFEAAVASYRYCTGLGARFFGVRAVLQVAAGMQAGASSNVYFGLCAPQQCTEEDVGGLAATGMQYMLGLAARPRMTGIVVNEMGNWTEMHVDFVIAGFAKCGTTTLAAYLNRHPGLQLADVDVDAGEPYHEDSFFLSSDLLPSRRAIARFQQRHGRPQGAVKIGIKYPHVIFRDLVMWKLSAASPAVRLILLVRDPIDWLESTYRFYHTLRRKPPPFLDHILSRDRERVGLRMFSTEVYFSAWIGRLWSFGYQRRQLYVMHQDMLEEAAERLCAFLGVPGRPPGPPPHANVNHVSGFDLCQTLSQDHSIMNAVMHLKAELTPVYVHLTQMMWDNGEVVPASFFHRKSRCDYLAS